MMEQEAKQALANESAIDVSEIPDRSVAVLYFQNLGSSENLTPLQKGIADMLITDLSQVKELKVVERVKMQKLLEEMGLGQSGLVDASTAPRFGRLLGAGKMVNGSFVDLDQNNIRIDAGMIDTKSSEVQRGKEVTGELERFFRLEKNLALNIIDDMGITLSEEERKAILFIPTESMLAFLAYSKGLDYEDRGMYDQAEAQYQKAVQIDPNFTRARQKSETVTNLEDGNFELSAIEETMTSTQTVEAIDTRSRLESVATNIDRNFVPNIENREPVPEQTNSTTFGSGVPVEIEITIPR
jgi:TolB-like protein